MPAQNVFVVVGNSKARANRDELHTWLQEVAKDPGVKVKKTSGNPAVRLQIEASDETVAALRCAYDNRLIFELDAPLSPMA